MRFDPAMTLGARLVLNHERTPSTLHKGRARKVTRFFAWILLVFLALCLGGSLAATVHRSIF